MKQGTPARSILHVDLDPFFVSVERSLDPALRGRAVVVGGDAESEGVVAAASVEARALGVRPGQPLAAAKRRCPEGVFRPGDFETYARVSEDVTAILLDASRRVERPSVDEAYVDLTPEGGERAPVGAAEAIKDELQRRLGLDAALGLASTRLAARVASSWARPRGLLLVLPGYERSFLSRQPVSCLPELPTHIEEALREAAIATLGDLLQADDAVLVAAVGATAAARLKEAGRGEGEAPIEIAAPPVWIQEETTLRSRRNDTASLHEILESLATRACRRLRPFGLCAETVTVEVHRGQTAQRRLSDPLSPGVCDEDTARAVVRALAEPLLNPAATVRKLHVRFNRLARVEGQGSLFPEFTRSAR